jgi:hypothetical protein
MVVLSLVRALLPASNCFYGSIVFYDYFLHIITGIHGSIVQGQRFHGDTALLGSNWFHGCTVLGNYFHRDISLLESDC